MKAQRVLTVLEEMFEHFLPGPNSLSIPMMITERPNNDENEFTHMSLGPADPAWTLAHSGICPVFRYRPKSGQL